MTITLLLVLIGSIICTVKFSIETERVLSGKTKSKSKSAGDSEQLIKMSLQDGGKLMSLLFIIWIASVIFIGMGILVFPLLVISLAIAPSMVSLFVRKYIINDQIICFGASLMILGIILSLFILML